MRAQEERLTQPTTLTQAVLHAGDLSALLEGADLRYVHWGGVEIVWRIYVGVRDPNWGTVPATIESLEVDEDDRLVPRAHTCADRGASHRLRMVGVDQRLCGRDAQL